MAGRPQRFELRLTTQERVRLEKLIASSETASPDFRSLNLSFSLSL